MPARGTRKSNPLTHRLSTNVDGKLLSAFHARAVATNMSDAQYLRHLIETDTAVTQQTPMLRRRSQQRMQLDGLAHEVNRLGIDVRKVGVNINQLAKQANTGLVPISRGEAVTMMSELQLVMNRAVAALERVLA